MFLGSCRGRRLPESSQLPVEFSGRLFNQYRAGPLSFNGRYLMAWRPSSRAMWIWRRKSSIHTAGSVVPSYDSIFMGLNPSGNSCSITSSVKQRGCAAPLYWATLRRTSDGVRLRFSARAWLGLSRPNRYRRRVSRHVLAIRRSILYVLHYCPVFAADRRYVTELFYPCLYGEVGRSGVRLELPLYPDRVVVDQPHCTMAVCVLAPHRRTKVAICASGSFWLALEAVFFGSQDISPFIIE